MKHVIAPVVGLALLALVSEPAAADTCGAYGKASRGYADTLGEADKYKFESKEWCRLYRKAQAFAKQAAKTARGCKGAQSVDLWTGRYPPKDVITKAGPC